MSCVWERLSDDIQIAVTQEHTFGTDAVLLAAFANIKRKDRAVDMGTGCGIIPFLWLRDDAQLPVHCLDIQENAIAQVNASVAHNQLEGRLIPHHCDLRNLAGELPPDGFTLVTMNPPYKPLNTGMESLGESARIARHEVCCTVEDAVKAANYLLTYGGRFCMCHRPERLVDVLATMRQYKIEPKRLRFVADKEGEQPFLFLVEGRKGGKPFVRVEAMLTLKNAESKFSAEMLKIYGSYADGYEDKVR